jgi:hypothetical protein
MSAAGAAIAMSTQRGGAAKRDGHQHFSVLPVDPLATVFNKRLSIQPWSISKPRPSTSW